MFRPVLASIVGFSEPYFLRYGSFSVSKQSGALCERIGLHEGVYSVAIEHVVFLLLGVGLRLGTIAAMKVMVGCFEPLGSVLADLTN